MEGNMFKDLQQYDKHLGKMQRTSFRRGFLSGSLLTAVCLTAMKAYKELSKEVYSA